MEKGEAWRHGLKEEGCRTFRGTFLFEFWAISGSECYGFILCLGIPSGRDWGTVWGTGD